MGLSESPVSRENAAPPSSFAQRLVGIFTSPSATFVEISRRPDFLPPLVFLVLTSVATAEAVLAKIGMERIIRNSLELSGRASKMSAEQMQQAIEQGSRFGTIIGHASGLLAVPVILLIIAGLGLLIVSGIFGGELNFKKAFTVSAYAYIPTTLRSLMALVLVFFGDADRFNPENPAPSSIGFFLNPLETSRPLVVFASALDIFTIWFLALLAIGLAAATNRKVKPLWVFFSYLGLWMVWVLGATALASLS